jgi:CrcB protein
LACVRALGAHSALGTLLVNLAGCLLVGFCMGAGIVAGSVRHAAVVVGFLGALTTFSAFSLDVVLFLENRQPSAALAYVGGNLLGGLAAVAAGLSLGRALAQ